MVRSSSEQCRADLLNHAGVAWFYEVRRFTLSDGSTYLPDFWITDVSVVEARLTLGDTPTHPEILQFLHEHTHWLEDTKGWFGPKQKNYSKIHRFVAEGLHPKFSVLVMGKDTRRLFGTVPADVEDPRLR